MRLLSTAQCLGYVAFSLGVVAFVQKLDRRLKVWIASESMVYALHFLLLANVTACLSALISGFRTLLSLKTRSLGLALLIMAVNILVAIRFARSGAHWLPVIASCAATLAIFKMQGIALRLVLLASTSLWLANNIISGSVGGTMLESVIAVANLSTIFRMSKSPPTTSLVSSAEAIRADS